MSILSNNTAKIGLITFFSSLYFYLPILTIYYQTKGLNFVQINSLWGFLIGAIFLVGVLSTPFVNYLRTFQPPYFALSQVPSVWLGLALGTGGLIAIISSQYAYK